MSRLKVNTTVIRDYTWDDKPLESLSREELLEAVKVLALGAQIRPADVMSFPQYQAIARGAGPTVVADAYAHQRQNAYQQNCK